jgi:hypothetical protein
MGYISFVCIALVVLRMGGHDMNNTVPTIPEQGLMLVLTCVGAILGHRAVTRRNEQGLRHSSEPRERMAGK